MSKPFQEFCLSQALRFRIGDDGKLYGSISHSSGEFYVAPEVLGILCEIAMSKQKLDIKKITKNLDQHYKSILENLPTIQECEAIIKDLVASGLVLERQKKSSRYLQGDGFGDDWIQWAMLADSPRTTAYEKAIRAGIDKNSVVADVGAGTGLLTSMCLKQGAKKVFAIEETQIAQKIVPLLNELKLPTQKEKLVVHNENSFDVALPENITHIVSELFGNDPFSEGVIPTLRNIAKNFTKQPVYIPKKISLYFELIEIIDHPIKHRLQSCLEKPTSDFLIAAKEILSFDNISFPFAANKNNFKRLTKPIELGQLPLNPPSVYANKKTHPLTGRKKIKVTEGGACVAGLMWFRVYLDDTTTISSNCCEKDAAEHWSPILILIDESILLKNKEIEITYGLDEQETKMLINFD
ncbi:MAG: hypothetical protein V4591_10330 [Bdellovibrionota bacterium]